MKEMNRKIYLLGTSHEYQRNDDSCTENSINEFMNYLRDICKRYNIKSIAEEMSEEALEFYEKTISIPKVLSQELSDIAHQYSDPNSEEKAKLGIKRSGYYTQGVQFPESMKLEELKGLTQDEADLLEWEEDLKREPVWIEKILLLSNWPILFICGSKHIESFKKLLCERGISVEVLHLNWQPMNLEYS